MRGRWRQAGADALELNIYFIPTDPDMSGREVEQRYIDILKAVKRAVKIPVAVKIGPYFSAMGHMAAQLVEAGADGLVLFNRFYEPDIDLARLALAAQSRTEHRRPKSACRCSGSACLAGRIERRSRPAPASRAPTR